MSSYGDDLVAKTIVCDSLRANVEHVGTVHHSETLNIQNPAKTGATSKVINATAGANAGTTVLGFYGATPVDQPATIDAAAAAAATPDNTSPFGFADAAAMNAYTASVNAIKDQLNLVIAALKEVGLVATS